MDVIITYSKILLQVIFYLLVPLAALLFRIRKTITTAFLIGIIITSVVLGVLSTASVKRDPVDKFIELINSKKYNKAKSQLQIVIQFGPEKVKEIKEKDIAYIALFNRMKAELKVYYYGIAKDYYKKYDFNEITSCKDLKDHISKMKYLKHALLLTDFARSIGGNDPVREQLTSKISEGMNMKKLFKGSCKDID